MKQSILCCVLAVLTLMASITSVASEETSSDAARYVALTKEIRCVVCQNQSIADSAAPLADDLRQKVYTMILEKKSDAEIKDYLVKRYGEVILLRPRFNANTWLLWLMPFLGMIAIATYVWRHKAVTP